MEISDLQEDFSPDPGSYIETENVFGHSRKVQLGNLDSATGDKTFTQSFSGQTVVTVNHNLGKKPAVTVIDSANDECVGDVVHTNNNSLVVTFSASFSGIIVCN